MLTKKITTASILRTIHKHAKKNEVYGKARAGESGNLLESVVFVLEEIGFISCKSCKRNVKYASLFDEPEIGNRIECNVPYNSILKQTADRLGLRTRKGTSRTEFVLIAVDINPTKEFPNIIKGQENRIRVECKHQQVSGTTEYKLLHSYLDLRYGAPEENSIMLVDGVGFTPNQISFIREVCNENTIIWTKGTKQPNNVVFMNINEFVDWVNRAF